MPARVVKTRIQDLDDFEGTLTDGQFLEWNDTLGQFELADVPVGDLSYTHNQVLAATTWVVVHNLGKYPSITVVDTAGSVIYGDITHDSTSQATLSFSAAFSGSAYCN